MKQNLPIYYCNVTLSIQNSNRSPVMNKTFQTIITYSKDGKTPICNPMNSTTIKKQLPTNKTSTVSIKSIEKIHHLSNTAY